MILLRRFPVLAFMLVLMGIAGVCLAQRSMGLMILAGTLAAISWYITEGPRGRTLPRWVSNILVIAVSLNVFLDLIQHKDDVLGVLGRFAVWLTLIKLYERRHARDYAQLLTLSLLLMMTACLQAADLLFGVLLLLYTIIGLYVLLLYQLYASFERARNERQLAIPADYRLVPPLKPIIGRNATWRFRAQCAGIALMGAVVSSIVFVGFPRGFGADVFGVVHMQPISTMTRFSWDVDLNSSGRINESHNKVLDLQLLDSAGQPMHPTKPLLLRGAVLDVYVGKGHWVAWQRSSSRRIIATDDLVQPLTTTPLKPDEVVTQIVKLNQPADGITPLFTIYAPTAVALEKKGMIIYEPGTQCLRTDDEAWHLGGYVVQACASPRDQTLDEIATPARQFVRPHWFEESDLNTLRSIADARLTAAGLSTSRPQDRDSIWQWNLDAANALSEYLHSSEFTYTLDLSTIVATSPNDDPIVRFLATSKRGHCEYFASGLAALLHSKGIPARLAVGYVAYDFDETFQQYTVLDSNAHAWVEVATGPRRWTAIDPTPPSTIVSMTATPTSLADQMRWAYQRVEGNWSSSIVNFSGNSQTQLADSFGRKWSVRLNTLLSDIRNWMDRVNQSFYFGPAGYIWMGIVAFALLIAVVALVKLMRRSMAIRRTLHLQHIHGAEYQRMLRQLGFYLDMLQVLQRGRCAKPSWQPPMQFARDLAGRNPQAGELVQRITNIFYEARYGRQRMDSSSAHDARQLVGQLAAVLNVNR